MKSFVASGLLAFATLCTAQFQNLPNCAKPCAATLPPNCKLDVKCICSDQSWITGIACCIKNGCPESDQAKTIQVATQICDTVNVKLPQAATCPANSGTAGGQSAAGSAVSSATMMASSAVGGAKASASNAVSNAANGVQSVTSAAGNVASSATGAAAAAATGAALGLGSNIGAVGAAVAALALLNCITLSIGG